MTYSHYPYLFICRNWFKFIFPLILIGIKIFYLGLSEKKNILFRGQTFIILLTYYMMIYNLKIFYNFCLKFYF